MYFLITLTAAIAVTIIWYVKAPRDKYKLGTLCLIYWGASLMWFIDHVMAYFTEGGEFFEITLDATLLGVTVVLAGLIVWLVTLLVSDPKGILKNKFSSIRG